jgi:hypothetical protein
VPREPYLSITLVFVIDKPGLPVLGLPAFHVFLRLYLGLRQLFAHAPHTVNGIVYAVNADMPL